MSLASNRRRPADSSTAQSRWDSSGIRLMTREIGRFWFIAKKYLPSGTAAIMKAALHAQPFGADLAERTLYTGAVNQEGASVPVTARLSKRFYEQLGDDIANELVDWFNQVDATYRTDLRELNELNFSRFDAKVEQRFAESEARVEKR